MIRSEGLIGVGSRSCISSWSRTFSSSCAIVLCTPVLYLMSNAQFFLNVVLEDKVAFPASTLSSLSTWEQACVLSV